MLTVGAAVIDAWREKDGLAVVGGCDGVEEGGAREKLLEIETVPWLDAQPPFN